MSKIIEEYKKFIETLKWIKSVGSDEWNEWDNLKRSNYCAGCKHINSDICNNCKRQWIDKDDYFELNLYTDTFGAIEEVSKQLYEEPLEDNLLNEWKHLWRT